jgi:hypothetical protein
MAEAVSERLGSHPAVTIAITTSAAPTIGGSIGFGAKGDNKQLCSVVYNWKGGKADLRSKKLITADWALTRGILAGAPQSFLSLALRTAQWNFTLLTCIRRASLFAS